MARTTVNLDVSILRELKRRARSEGKTLGAVIAELVAPALAKADTRRTHRFRWHTSDMGPAKVDLEDKEAVRRAIEAR